MGQPDHGIPVDARVQLARPWVASSTSTRARRVTRRLLGLGTPQDRWNPDHRVAVHGAWNVTGTVRLRQRLRRNPWNNEGASMPTDCLFRRSARTRRSTPELLGQVLHDARSLRVVRGLSELGDLRVGHPTCSTRGSVRPAATYGFVSYNYNYAYSGATGTRVQPSASVYTFSNRRNEGAPSPPEGRRSEALRFAGLSFPSALRRQPAFFLGNPDEALSYAVAMAVALAIAVPRYWDIRVNVAGATSSAPGPDRGAIRR